MSAIPAQVPLATLIVERYWGIRSYELACGQCPPQRSPKANYPPPPLPNMTAKPSGSARDPANSRVNHS